ncbi:MAG: cation-translocating P-type ATPase [Pirellulaceae bacterium]
MVEIAIAAAVAGNLMLIAIALYAGWVSGMDANIERYLRWVSAGLGAIALAGPGRTFFRQAWAGLRAGVPNMDLPIALGLGLGTTVGWINTFRDTGAIYFDSLGMLVFLLLVGRWIQYRQTRRASDDIRRLYELTPSRARRVSAEGEARWVPASALTVGDRVRVLGNETIPADGIVVSGRTSIDRSLLTGESTPVEIAPGDAVHGGMNNIESPIELEVTAVGGVSRLGRLIDLVENAALKRTRLVQRADALGGWFVVVIVVATLATALGWSWVRDPHAWDHAIALAIVACPCALGLATPLAIAVAVGRAARQRLLVKGGDALERLVHPGTIWFDKTGTLTEGRTSVRSWVGDRSVIEYVVALESLSNHQAARAITRDSSRWSLGGASGTTGHDGASSLSVEQVQQGETGGIAGVVAGRDVRVGTSRFVGDKASIDPRWERWSDWVARQGCTPILAAVDGAVVAGVSVGDALRGETASVIARLKQLGWQVGVLSGDHPRVVAGVARELGIESRRALGSLSPEQKVEVLIDHRHQGTGPCVMVGDGMNDSAALAAADVGISVQSGAEISLRSADVYFGRSGLLPLLGLLQGARRTVNTIQLGLGVSLMYNALAVILAAAGQINPLVAAALMPVSSLTVLAIAVGGRAFKSGTMEGPTLAAEPAASLGPAPANS